MSRLAPLLAAIALLSACPAERWSSDGPLVDGRTPEAGGHVAECVTPGEDSGVVPGDPGILLLRGTVVAPDEILSPGEVLTDGDNIVCVAESCAGEAKAEQATVVDTSGIIFPGLIDAHNHTQYNYLPLWKHSRLFSNHNQWQASSEYDTFIAPHRTLDGTLMCEMIKYGEIRSLIAGTTMIQGTPLRTCADTLIRNADLPYHGLFGGDTIRTNVLGISNVDAAAAQQLKDEFASGKTRAYVLHLAEGVDETARREFDRLEALGLLLPQVVIVHGTALGATELTKIKNARMPMIWSPSSNVDLYGETNDAATMKSLGISLSLSPDWTPSGEPNLLDELRAARKLDDDTLGGIFSNKDLFEMVTINPAAALAFDEEVGSLAPGKRADLLVIKGDNSKPYDALLAAGLADVRLVVVAGKPLYGDPPLLNALKSNDYCECIAVCETAKMLCVKESESPTNLLDQTFSQIQAALSDGYPGLLDLSTGCL